jgi:hypothetical protein
MSNTNEPYPLASINMPRVDKIDPDLLCTFRNYTLRNIDAYRADVSSVMQHIGEIAISDPIMPENLPQNEITDAVGVSIKIGFDFTSMGGLIAYSRFLSELQGSGVYNPALMREEHQITTIKNARFSGSRETVDITNIPFGNIPNGPDKGSGTPLYVRYICPPSESNKISLVNPLGIEIATIDPLIYAFNREIAYMKTPAYIAIKAAEARKAAEAKGAERV